MRPLPNPFPLLENLRIAIVLTSFDLGGAERQAIHLASYLQDVCRARVAVVALFGGTGDQPVRGMCVERRLACLRVNMPEHVKGVPTFQSVRQFARDIAFFQPDLLLPYTTLPNVLCGIVWQMAGAKACIWNQRDEGRELAPDRWHGLALRNASQFISNSTEGAEFLAAKCGVARERIELIFNGVELAAPRQTAGEVRAKLGLSESDFVGVMLANIHQYKDHATLVRAWGIVCQRLPGMHPILLLAGREDDGGAIRRLIASLGMEGRVRLMGAVGDVSSLLHAVDVSVFSSSREGTPNAVLESMAAGRAVVATDIAGCRDALGEGYAGLVQEGNAGAMAGAILEVVQLVRLRDEWGTTLAFRARNMFGVKKMCERSCAVVQRALS
jgi:glycosyltransferase involved in cell wall biosynthesis